MRKELLLYPRHFGPNVQEVLLEKLISSVEGSCSGRYGFVVCVTDIFETGKGQIREGAQRSCPLRASERHSRRRDATRRQCGACPLGRWRAARRRWPRHLPDALQRDCLSPIQGRGLRRGGHGSQQARLLRAGGHARVAASSPPAHTSITRHRRTSIARDGTVHSMMLLARALPPGSSMWFAVGVCRWARYRSSCPSTSSRQT